ncbi:MAG: DUF4276 family protein [Peptococcaceae bacterium]|jgi:hypothetical protein|nr:DUF4276 family protein [Peptococcaceae bacterium]
MSKIVFLLEEPSIKEFLQVFLPGILPPRVTFQLVPHDGKQDLERSIPRKMRAWREPGVRFVVVRDQDGADCRAVKDKLGCMCAEAGRDDSLVRIVCNELEAWFLGDLAAVAGAYDEPSVARMQNKSRYRNPDSIIGAARELKRIVPEYQKLSGARKIAEHIDVMVNGSKSFHVFVDGVLRLVGNMK